MIIHRLLTKKNLLKSYFETIFVGFKQPDILGFIIILQIGFQLIVAMACIVGSRFKNGVCCFNLEVLRSQGNKLIHSVFTDNNG